MAEEDKEGFFFKMAIVITVILLLLQLVQIFATPEQGIFHFDVNEKTNVTGIAKSLYQNSTIKIIVYDCKTKDDKTAVVVQYIILEIPCATTIDEESFPKNYSLLRPKYFLTEHFSQYGPSYYLLSKKFPKKCGNGTNIFLETEANNFILVPQATPSTTTTSTTQASTAQPQLKSLKKRAVINSSSKSEILNANKTKEIQHLDHVTVKRDDIYLLFIWIHSENDEPFNVSVTVTMKGEHGYLSAIDWPLLPFYGTMCIIYIIYGLVWFIVSAIQWRDLLRIQFWIGAVIILGMLEKAVFYAEFQSAHSTGCTLISLAIFAELVSVLKRSLARMLVSIVSVGFGIVKPRLGQTLHRVLGMGTLYFILGILESSLRVLRPKNDPSNQALLANIPLAVLDAVICWWVFSSLVQTMKTLLVRRNVVKLTLYKYFTNTLIFAVLASVAFMIWSVKVHKFTQCLTDWKELWVDEAYWHLLFSVILLVIMILWRPTNNNQRYAFLPLLDNGEEEDEAEEQLMNDAFEGMKMRSSKHQTNGSPKFKDIKKGTTEEENLKWVEDNIPASLIPLPTLLDSEEEIMTTKYEISKME